MQVRLLISTFPSYAEEQKRSRATSTCEHIPTRKSIVHRTVTAEALRQDRVGLSFVLLNEFENSLLASLYLLMAACTLRAALKILSSDASPSVAYTCEL